MLVVTIDYIIMVSKPEYPYYGFVVCQFALAQWDKNRHFAVYASCMPSPRLYSLDYNYIHSFNAIVTGPLPGLQVAG